VGWRKNERTFSRIGRGMGMHWAMREGRKEGK